MPKFYVTVVSKSYYTVMVEAEDKEKAREDFNWEDVWWSDPENIETDIEDVIQVHEMPDCPKCGGKLSFDNVTAGYVYACPACDEDFGLLEDKK